MYPGTADESSFLELRDHEDIDVDTSNFNLSANHEYASSTEYSSRSSVSKARSTGAQSYRSVSPVRSRTKQSNSSSIEESRKVSSGGESSSRNKERRLSNASSDLNIFETEDSIPLQPSLLDTDPWRIEDEALPKNLRLVEGVSLIVGMMIGSGIFATPGLILNYTKSIGATLTVWVGSGLLSLSGSLCYAELGTVVTTNGGEHSYLLEAFGPFLAFLFTWTSITMLKTGSAAIISTVCAQYLCRLFFMSQLSSTPLQHSNATTEFLLPNSTISDPQSDESAALADLATPYLIKLIAVSLMVAVTIINSLSTNFSTRLQDVFTWLKLAAVAIISTSGIVFWIQGKGAGPLRTIDITKLTGENSWFGETSPGVEEWAFAFYSGLWAYDGWNNLNYVTGELKNPTRDLPLSIFIAMPIVTFSYLFANIAYLLVLPYNVIVKSDAIALDFGHAVFGKVGSIIMPIFVVISTFGALNATVFTTSRLIHSASSQGHLPSMFSRIHPVRRTPMTALFLQFIITTLLILPTDFVSLLNLYSFLAWIFFGLTGIALIVLRVKLKYRRRGYKVYWSTALVFILVCGWLIVVPVIRKPLESLVALAWVMLGAVLWALK